MTIFVVEFIHIKIFVDYFLSNVLTSHTFGQTLSTTLPKLPKHPSVEAQQWLEFRLTCFVFLCMCQTSCCTVIDINTKTFRNQSRSTLGGWHGPSRITFDSSGLTQYAYRAIRQRKHPFFRKYSKIRA
ncbi:unnamed protein product [Tenebrio molitor]|nr:unnamed protein product [Tenebrio molitor]